MHSCFYPVSARFDNFKFVNTESFCLFSCLHAPADALVFFPVRFHFMGQFVRDGCSVDYVGEEVLQAQIPRDDLCYKEIVEYAQDCYQEELGRMDINLHLKLHWLVPRKTFSDGLMCLVNDDSIKIIDMGIPYGEMADIFVE